MAKIFKIEGNGLMPLFIEADSFDDALFQARLIDKNYVSGRLASDTEIINCIIFEFKGV